MDFSCYLLHLLTHLPTHASLALTLAPLNSLCNHYFSTIFPPPCPFVRLRPAPAQVVAFLAKRDDAAALKEYAAFEERFEVAFIAKRAAEARAAEEAEAERMRELVAAQVTWRE
jgi:hypothetical protein